MLKKVHIGISLDSLMNLLLLSGIIIEGKMKIIRNIVYWLLILCLPILIITTNIALGVTSMGIYDYGLNKYPITQVTGIDYDELRKVYRHLTDFYNLKVDSPQVTVSKGGEKIDIFNERELIHLEDIKDLIQLDYTVQRTALIVLVIGAIVLFLLLKERWQLLIKAFFWGSVLTLGIMIALILWSLFGFEQLFLLFSFVQTVMVCKYSQEHPGLHLFQPIRHNVFCSIQVKQLSHYRLCRSHC